MNNRLNILVIVLLFVCSVWVLKAEIWAAALLFYLGIFFLMVRLITNEQRKTEKQMGKLIKKVGKSKEDILNLLGKIDA